MGAGEPLEVIESDLYTFDEVDKMVEDGRISLGNAILCWIGYKKKMRRSEQAHAVPEQPRCARSLPGFPASTALYSDPPCTR